MKTPIKLLSLLLAIFLLSTCLFACAEPTNDPQQPNTPGTTEPGTENPEDPTTPGEPEKIKPDIPETYDFNDAEISFLYWYVSAWENTVRYCRDIYSESISGDPIPDEVYSRNAFVEENYNVKITLTMQQQNEINSTILTNNSTGDSTYLVTVPRLLEQASLVVNGAFHNLYDVNHIDFEKPWWDQNSIAQLSSNGMLNLVATALMVNDKDATAGLAFNKQAINDYNLDNPYDYVRDYTWTYEAVAEFADQANTDVNGDDEMDESDFWGFLGKNDVSTSFFHGSGGLFVSKNEDDEFVLDFGLDEIDIDASAAIYDTIMGEDFFYNHHQTGISDDEYTELFTSGNGLFFWMRLDEVTNMRGSETNFGILPIPMYDEMQEEYFSTVSQHTTGLLSIPLSTSGDDLNMVGMVLEALSAHSYYDLQNEYIEVSLKGRYARDDESEEMLDIILGNRVFDPGCIFGFAKFADNYQSDISTGKSVTTLFAGAKEMTETAIEEFNDKILSN